MAAKKKCVYCSTFGYDHIRLNGRSYCDFDCVAKYGIEKTAKDREKQAKKLIKQDNKKHAKKKREFYANDKSKRTTEAQKAFNAFIRKRDDKLPCISCGKFITKVMPWGQYDCGHFLTRGGFPELRFEELNAHKQCKSCNGGSGNFSQKDRTVREGYRINLINKIGLDKVEWLEGPHEAKKYTCADLKEIELIYKQKIKAL